MTKITIKVPSQRKHINHEIKNGIQRQQKKKYTTANMQVYSLNRDRDFLFNTISMFHVLQLTTLNFRQLIIFCWISNRLISIFYVIHTLTHTRVFITMTFCLGSFYYKNRAIIKMFCLCITVNWRQMTFTIYIPI